MKIKVAWIHEHVFLSTNDGSVFSKGKLPYSTWRRYLKHFSDMIIIGRSGGQCAVKDLVGLTLSSGDRVAFHLIPDMLSPLQMIKNRAIVSQTIRNVLKRVDAVIVRQSPLGWLAAEEATRLGIPWAVEVVADAWNAYWNYGTLVAKLYAPKASFDARYWLSRAKFAIYVTREYLQKQYPCKGVSYGVSDVQVFPVSEEVLENRILRWKAVEEPSPELVMIGMIGSLFNRYKGLHVALRSLRRLKDRGIRLALRVLGNGHLDAWRQEAARLGVADLLFLDGSLPSGEPVFRWLDGLDVYIQPSFQEGLPRALIEAMSRGLPALGSTCGGIPELLPKGCLHRPGDDKKLAAQLEQMLRDRSWRIAQAQRNFNEAKNYYVERIERHRDAFWQVFVKYVQETKAGS